MTISSRKYTYFPRSSENQGVTKEIAAADALRPDNWDAYIGQEALKNRLKVHIASAKARQKPLDHVLLTGPAGMGKTTLAALIAAEMDKHLLIIDMPMKDDDLRALNGFNGVVLLDEIHRGTPKQQEDLLAFLEHGKLKIKGRYPMTFVYLTVIGATTEPQKLIAPLKDRFLIQPRFEDYTDDDMARIVVGMARRVKSGIPYETALGLAGACAGVPRRASHLISAARDLELANGTAPTTEEILTFCELTPDGLSPEHLEYLRAMMRLGEPAGLSTLTNLLDLSGPAVKAVERHLTRLEYILPTGRGRELTQEGAERAQQLGLVDC